MKTSIDLVSIVYKIVCQSNVKDLTKGGVYINQRPLKSNKNDVVIGALSVTENTLQMGTINIQIYAQDIYKENTYYPNLKLLNDALKILKPLFKDLYIPNEKTYIDVESERYYKVDNTQEWVSVIKLYSRNIN